MNNNVFNLLSSMTVLNLYLTRNLDDSASIMKDLGDLKFYGDSLTLTDISGEVTIPFMDAIMEIELHTKIDDKEYQEFLDDVIKTETYLNNGEQIQLRRILDEFGIGIEPDSPTFTGIESPSYLSKVREHQQKCDELMIRAVRNLETLKYIKGILA
jgi:hypothetical protein